MKFTFNTLVLMQLGIFATSAFANDQINEKRVSDAISSFSKGNATAFCKFPGLKPMGTRDEDRFFITRYELNDFIFDVKYPYKGNRNKPMLVGVNKEISIPARKSGRAFFFNFQNSSPSEKRIIEKYGIGNSQTGYNHIYCSPLYGEKLISLDTDTVHINMHPHTSYDRNGVTKESAQRLVDDSSYESVVLLETPRMKKWGVNVYEIKTKINEETKLYTAPGGNGNFQIRQDDLNVTYTGGYVNFCIASNSKSLLADFLQQSRGGKLTITFDAQGLMGQQRPWGDYDEISLKYISYLKDLFDNSPKEGEKFKNGQIKFYKKRFTRNEIKPLFSTVKFSFVSNGVNHTEILKGTGDKNFEFEIKYINE